VKNIVKVQVCNLRLIDNIEQIGHSDANIEWSSDEHLDWLSGIKIAFKVYFFLNFFQLFWTLCFELRNYDVSQIKNIKRESTRNRDARIPVQENARHW